MSTELQESPEVPTAGDVGIDLSDLPMADGDVIDMPTDDEDGEPDSIVPCKRCNDFYVDFLEVEKRKHIGPDNIGDTIKSIDFGQMDVTLAPVRKKKRRPSQEDMPWLATIIFYDDPANQAIEFIELLKERGQEPLRIRVQSMDKNGKALETFVLKGAVPTRFPQGYSFNLEKDTPRLLVVTFTFDEMRRKSAKAD